MASWPAPGSRTRWKPFEAAPLSATLLAFAALALIVPMVLRMRGKGQVLSQLAAEED